MKTIRRCLQAGTTVLFFVFLISTMKPLTIETSVDPQLTAGASRFLTVNLEKAEIPNISAKLNLTVGASAFPIVDWKTTEVEIKKEEETTTLNIEPEKAQEVEDVKPVQEETIIVEETITEETITEETLVEETPVIQYSGNLPAIYDVGFFELVVQAEGYTMGYEGMRYITSSILNLARSRGCSVDEVLTSGAYTVVNNGTVWNQSLYSETIAAVEDELYGGQIDTEIKYFRTNYYHGFGTPCFHYGNVYFSK